MDLLFLGIVVFLFLLAIFDLSVGVSNDAVNFLNSAIGAKAASFKVIIIIAAVGVFTGAAMSNGMMDIARHGIFRPEYFCFYELMCIFMAVMTTDIVLLDIFNSLGMPTSTTVSMVFELLGASFALALLKVASDTSGLTFLDLLNTEKALSVILGIFLSVGIAFFFGTLVQYLTRLCFSFNYKRHLAWRIGIFGGVATTAIIYFLLIKGIKDLAFMTPEVKQWIHTYTPVILLSCLVGFTVLMQILHWCRVNVFKIIVLLGTFSLAMAFAGNDLVNFIGVPLAGFSSYQDYVTNGTGDPYHFLMGSLNGPARTPVIFLIAAGAIMVFSLATSKKAYNVVKTSVDLARQDTGDEMFGSSKVARSLVRRFMALSTWVISVTPPSVRQWVNSRFNTEESQLEEGAAFDLVRASINLVLAGLLVALGTSLKLPLSTTYVTFMVAMGTSLADRAWGRETAVFRITGVLSVIGGWFITAGAAFVAAALVVTVMFFGGKFAIAFMALLALFILYRSNVRYKQKAKEEKKDVLFQAMLASDNREETWMLLRQHILLEQKRFMEYAERMYLQITDGFMDEDLRSLRKAERSLSDEKSLLKNTRRKEMLCLRRIPKELAIEKSTWFHLGSNSCVAIMYNLRRIGEVCREHVDNNFMPLPAQYREDFLPLRNQIAELFQQGIHVWETERYEETVSLRNACEEMKSVLSEKCKEVIQHLQEDDPSSMTVTYVYLNLLQESQEMLSVYRHLLRSGRKLVGVPA
ncbi:MAG: anion permease [Parabacteroides sp.]